MGNGFLDSYLGGKDFTLEDQRVHGDVWIDSNHVRFQMVKIVSIVPVTTRALYAPS